MNRMPESIKVLLCILIGVVLCCMLKLAVSDKATASKPKIAIARIQYYPPPIEGTGGYLLEWAKDGEMQLPAVFDSAEEREIFIKWLQMCGEVTR